MTNSSRNFFCDLLDTITEERLQCLVRQILLYPDTIGELDIDRLLGLNVQDPISRSSLSFKDYRLLDVRLLNVRLFPFDMSVPYGLDFTNNSHEACSSFIVGNNGFGKSSVYCALEYLYTGGCSYAHRMKEQPQKYLTNLFVEKMPEGHRTMNIVGKNPNQTYIQSVEKRPVGIPAAFTSDYDIEELERSDDNLYNYILRGMGYEDVLIILRQKLQPKIREKQERYRWLKNYLESDDAELNAKDYQLIKRELIQLSELADDKKANYLLRFSNTKKVYDLLKKLRSGEAVLNTKEELFSEEWDFLISNMQLMSSSGVVLKRRRRRIVSSGETAPTQDEVSLRIRRIKTLYKKLNYFYHMLGLPDARQDKFYWYHVVTVTEKLDKEYNEKDKQRDVTDPVKELERLRNELAVLVALEKTIVQRLTFVLQEYYKTFGSFIEETMTAFSFNGGYTEEFHIIFDDSSFRFKLELRDAHGEEPLSEISPRAYFNTFRFKLYALSFRLTLAFTYMKKNNVLIPIVIDDVFSASDFENGLKIEQFVYNIYKVYANQLHFGQPLQLILLTHDEMILNSFRRGIKLRYADDYNRNKKESEHAEDYFVCGRLYPFWKHEELKCYSKKRLGFHNIFFHYSISN